MNQLWGAGFVNLPPPPSPHARDLLESPNIKDSGRLAWHKQNSMKSHSEWTPTGKSRKCPYSYLFIYRSYWTFSDTICCIFLTSCWLCIRRRIVFLFPYSSLLCSLRQWYNIPNSLFIVYGHAL